MSTPTRASPKAIEMDCSLGEGGGQVARTALALAALQGKAIHLTKIRAGRKPPGLKQQHLSALQAIALTCGAECKGAFKGSQSLLFKPNQIKPVQFTVNIGTAGSVSLLIQQLLLVALKCELRVRVVGGTNVEWSPPIEFMQHLLFPLLKRMGARFSVTISKRGYFPKGKGIVNFSSKKARLPLKPICLTEFKGIESVMVFSHSSDLPKEVSLNQARAAKRAIAKRFPRTVFSETIEFREQSDTIGSGITLIAIDSEGNMLSASALGKRGKPAELVGREAAEKLIQQVSRGKAVDYFTADQLVPFMALAKGYSTIQCSKLTQHCLTNIAVCEKLLEVKFDVKGSLGEQAEIFVDGTAFK